MKKLRKTLIVVVAVVVCLAAVAGILYALGTRVGKVGIHACYVYFRPTQTVHLFGWGATYDGDSYDPNENYSSLEDTDTSVEERNQGQEENTKDAVYRERYCEETGEYYSYSGDGQDICYSPLERLAQEEHVRKAVVHNNIETIGEKTFSNCPDLEEVYVAASVKKIHMYAFENLKNVSIYFNGDAPWVVRGFPLKKSENCRMYYLPDTLGWDDLEWARYSGSGDWDGNKLGEFDFR